MIDKNSDDVCSTETCTTKSQHSFTSTQCSKVENDSTAVDEAVIRANSENELHKVDELLGNISSQLKLLNDSTLSELHADLDKQPESNLLSYVKQLTASSTSQILDKLESLAPMIESSTLQCEELQEIIKTQPIMTLDSLEEHQSTEEKLLEGLGAQREALATLHEIHSDILMLQSFQDLVSQATIRAVDAVDVIRLDLNRVKTTLDLIQGIDDEEHPSLASESDSSAEDIKPKTLGNQLGQNDVDSLFALIRENL